MSAYLRTSSSHLARVSVRGFDIAAHAQLRGSHRLAQRNALSASTRRRQYATSQPETPQDPEKKPGNEKSEDGKKDNKSVSKPAPGLEHVYSKQSPITKPSTSSSTSPSKPNEEAVNVLTSEDEEALKQMSGMLKMGMPKAQREEFDKAIEAMKKDGIPDDMREVLKTFKGEKEINLATAAKLIRIVTRISRKMSDIHFDSNQSGGGQKSGAHDAGPEGKQSGSGGKKKGGAGGKSFFEGNTSIFGFKLDTGTFLTTAFISYMVYRSLMPGENSREITWQEFRTQFLERGLVEKLTVVNGKRVRVSLNREAVKSVYPDSPAAHAGFVYYFGIGDVTSFERHLDQAQDELQIPGSQRIAVSYNEEISWAGTFFQLLPTLLLLGLPIYFLRRSAGGGGGGGAGGIFGMGKSRARKFNHETDVKVSFKDVAGMDEAKQEIMEFVSFLKEPSMYQKLGAKIPRGAILSGPPGTGKTLLAKATAGESKVPFFSVSGSEFVEMFVGVGASRVRDMFTNARKNAPCIIFIDEIDAIGKSRGKNNFGGGNDEREATLNQILTEMDGFNTSEQVVVLAGTNRADVLDKALMRPGRFDRHISIDKPTMEGRKQIFAVHLGKIVTKEEQNHLQGRLASLTPGFSGADIANCVNEAALIAARRGAESVTMKHFEDAIERVIGGLEKKSLVLNPEEKKTVAYHEAGHAICGWYFKYADPLLKVSIIPRGQGALGYAQYLPAGDSYLMNVNQLMDRMAMTLAGRVSEEIHFDTVTSGASDDFNKVTRMATAMVTKFGMSKKVGYLYYEDDASQQLHKPFSEETARSIDNEVKRIVDEAYKQCKDLLMEKKKEIGLVAEELLRKEMLTRDDMIRLLGKRPFEDNAEFTKYFGSRGDREGVEGSTPDADVPPPAPPGVSGPAPVVFKDAEVD